MNNDKIRKRVSYNFWLNIIKNIGCPTKAESTCEAVFNEMNGRNMFGTLQQSKWDEESMGVALNDFKGAWVKFEKI